jgi:two-component system sensor histidine kinase KdpD
MGWRLLLSIGSVAALTALLLATGPSIQQATASLLYILIVLIIATTFGLWLGISTSILAFLAFNFFIIYPYRAFGVTSVQDTLRLVTFLGVAVLASSLAGRARSQADAAAQRASELAALYNLSQTIGAEVALERILPIIVQTATRLLPIAACQVFLYGADGQLIEQAASGVATSDAVHEDVALQVDQQDAGLLRVTYCQGQEALRRDQRKLLQTIANQIVLVIERARLADKAGQARALADSDRLKSTLLSSVSHDLRTPLAAIKGAVTNLLNETVSWTPTARRELLSTIDEETDRLNRLVSDLLEMSRIEAAAIQRTRSVQDLGELIAHVVARLQAQLAQHQVEVDIAEDLPLVELNYTQIDRVISNLLENASRYAPPQTVITIQARATATQALIEVLDQGPGIPTALHANIFEKFVRIAGPERHAEGAGLGLAICKGLVEAHGGRIWAENRAGGGAKFSFTLPLAITQPVSVE